MPRYFCCRVTPSGIGDQVSQLKRLYNLGKSFGLEYLFQELPANKWSPDFDAWDFLGLGLGERRVTDFPDHEIVSVDGAAASYALMDGRPLASVLPRRMPDRAIVEFAHSGEMYSGRHSCAHASWHRSSCKAGPAAWRAHHDHHQPFQPAFHLRARSARRLHVGEKRRQIRLCGNAENHVEFPRSRPIACPEGRRLLPSSGRPRRTPPRCFLRSYGVSDGPTNIFPLVSSRHGRILYELARRDERLIQSLRLNRRGNPLQAFYNPMCDAEVRREDEHAKTDLQRLVARYEHSRLVVGTGRELTAATILAFASADVVVLARNPWVFPLLGLGDPQGQAVTPD